MKIQKIFYGCLGVSGLVFSFFFMLWAPTTASLYGRGVYNSCQYGNTCALTLSTSGTINLNAEATTSGVHTIKNDDVTVTTNSTLGYTLTLEMNSATVNALTATEGTVASSSATAASPAVLSGNQWGFRVDAQAGFGLGPTTAVNNQPSSALTFAGIPLLGSPVVVKTTNTDAPTGDTTSVWYGIRADTSQPAGSYSGTVLYTAVTL